MNLARSITNRTQVSSFSDEELLELDDKHQEEIFKLTARYELKVNSGFSENDLWLLKIFRSIKVLRIHHQWIKEERATRRKKYNIQMNNAQLAKKENLIKAQELLTKSHELKMQRIALQKDRDRDFLSILLGILKSTLGQDIYNQIIEATNEQLKKTSG